MARKGNCPACVLRGRIHHGGAVFHASQPRDETGPEEKASARVVLPEPVCPTSATLRILSGGYVFTFFGLPAGLVDGRGMVLATASANSGRRLSVNGEVLQGFLMLPQKHRKPGRASTSSRVAVPGTGGENRGPGVERVVPGVGVEPTCPLGPLFLRQGTYTDSVTGRSFRTQRPWALQVQASFRAGHHARKITTRACSQPSVKGTGRTRNGTANREAGSGPGTGSPGVGQDSIEAVPR